MVPEQTHNPAHSIQTPRQKNTKKTGLWAPLLFVVALVAVALWFWSNRDRDVRATDGPAVRSTLHLETFVLNLADTEQKSYLRVGVDLGLGLAPKRTTEGYPIARARDAILSVLAVGRADDLVTAQGKTQLKQDLLRALQDRVPEMEVREVYFTEFLIQR